MGRPCHLPDYVHLHSNLPIGGLEEGLQKLSLYGLQYFLYNLLQHSGDWLSIFLHSPLYQGPRSNLKVGGGS